MMPKENEDVFVPSQPKKAYLKIIGAIMGIAVVAFLGLILFSSGPQTDAGKAEMSLANYNWGCGNSGRCWTYCNTGNGWCYTSRVGYCWKKDHCQ